MGLSKVLCLNEVLQLSEGYSLLIELRNLEGNWNFDDLVTGETSITINNPSDD